jgi:[acyl-carrier-protein] S-malonyltransferase
MKTAWLFPGQGSQALGMGLDLLDIPAAKAKFDQADEILGWSIVDICQNDETKLGNTRYTQPCLYVIEAILVDLLKEKGLKPDVVAGHSLGECVALYAAGVFDFTTGLKLVKRRGELMSLASGGTMAALIGFDREQLANAIAETKDVVLANDNSGSQVVISGTKEAIEVVISKIKVKRAIPLSVSGAFHSPFMETAAVEFRDVLDTVTFNQPECFLLSNVDPTPSQDAKELKTRLSNQITGSVRWREICLKLPELGIEHAIEVGPGKVLAGLLKNTCKSIVMKNVGTKVDLDLCSE